MDEKQIQDGARRYLKFPTTAILGAGNPRLSWSKSICRPNFGANRSTSGRDAPVQSWTQPDPIQG